ncbi:MAG TPA: molybdenum cofactor biosynthesis protein MoaE [Terracidiphilus sp.]|nr:molybdenum cofactor biosynthesis protein MoaE [Terracidiphilus sp.]
MHVKVVFFGMLKEWLGSDAALIELEEGATVADLMRTLVADPRRGKRLALQLAGTAVGVNAEYAPATRVLHDGDEVALLPPVSGGTGAARTAHSLEQRSGEPTVTLTRERIETEKLIAEAKAAEDGAVVVFDGIVRNNSRGRATLYLEYQAYEEMALAEMRRLAAEAREKFGVRRVAMVHRLGRLEIGESSVLIVVASAHRAQAFDACRWLIDTLKQTVPIWKKETFADGAVWAPGEPFPREIAVFPAEAKHDS